MYSKIEKTPPDFSFDYSAVFIITTTPTTTIIIIMQTYMFIRRNS